MTSTKLTPDDTRALLICKWVHIDAELCRAARGLLNWTQVTLAREIDVCSKEIIAFENGRLRPHDKTLREIVQAFADAGVEIIPPEEGVHLGGVQLMINNGDGK